MAHVRQQIRDAAVTLLTGLTETGSNVFSSRDTTSYPLAEAELPALIVDAVDERSIEVGFAGLASPVLCECDLRVRVLTKSVSGYADMIDDIAVDVQTALANAGQVGGIAIVRYVGTDGPAVDASTDRPVAQAELSFTMRYMLAANAPETAL